MLKLSRKTRLALEAVLDIAYHARPEPVQSKEITRRQGIPQRYLEQVMQHLVREGVLKGVRGPRGGYCLARERRRISVGDVVRVVAALDADEADEGASSALGQAVVAPLWRELERETMARLDAVTLEDLVREAEANNVAQDHDATHDFTI